MKETTANKQQLPKITDVLIVDIDPTKIFMWENKIYVNSKMLPPLNSQPVKCDKIIITTEPKLNSLKGTTLTVDYKPEGPATPPYTMFDAAVAEAEETAEK